MAAAEFFAKVGQEIGNDMETEYTQQKVHRQQEVDEQKLIQGLMMQVDELEKSVVVRVPNLKNSDISIDKRNLHSEMEKTMVMQSNIIDDIYGLKCTQEKMKVLLNGLVGILHHNLRFRNQFKIKTAKEIETYIAKETSYNAINIRICNIQHLIDRSSEYSNMIKQKVGFIRDLTKMRTQEMFSEK